MISDIYIEDDRHLRVAMVLEMERTNGKTEK